ncbi:MAG: DUF4974 domain-containing protein [Cytophagales bacterium]|nr:DUF4974 domain-containing protein [Cytophagales bacterium]
MKVYSGDESVHTTLVEGKVKVEVMDGKRVKHSAFLMPDMQYKYCAEDKKVRIKKVDSKKFTQWMDHFQFNNETLKTIFRKMSRWYGVKFKVLDKELAAIRFSGQIKHFEDFTDVLELLKYKTNISFKILDDAVLIEKITGEDR